MNEIETRAQATVARILAETATPANAFAEHQRTPYHFDWAWTGKVGDSDYTYQKRYEPSVIEGRKASSSRGGGSTRGGGGLASMSLPCPQCHTTHSVMAACAKVGA